MIPFAVSRSSRCAVGPFQLVTALLIATLLPVTSGQAASLTNRDGREHKLSIVTGAASESHVLKPNQALSDICAKGCVIRLNDSEDDTYELEGSDAVVIEDGFLYYEGAPEPAAPAAPAGSERKPGSPG